MKHDGYSLHKWINDEVRLHGWCCSCGMDIVDIPTPEAVEASWVSHKLTAERFDASWPPVLTESERSHALATYGGCRECRGPVQPRFTNHGDSLRFSAFCVDCDIEQ